MKKICILSLSIVYLACVTSCGNSNNKESNLGYAFNTNFKSVYEVGDTLSYDGLVVYDKKSGTFIDDYDIYPKNKYYFGERDENFEITISKEGYGSTTFTVSVLNPGESYESSLDVYQLNDFHGAFSYDEKAHQTGLSRIGHYLLEKKSKNPNTIILSSGDMWQGGIESNNTKGNIVTEAMNIIGFDAMAIGNHEFDWDEDAIRKNVEMMKFPLLNNNIYYADSEKRPEYLKNSTLVDLGEIQVGIIGTCSSTLGNSILPSISKKFDFRSPIEQTKKDALELKSKGADYVLLATHDGGFSGKDLPSLFFYKDLVDDFNYVDGIFLGHDHKVKKGQVNDVPYIESGSNGENISHIKYKFKVANGHINKVSFASETIRTIGSNFTQGVKEIDDLIIKYKDEIGDLDRVICNLGYTSKNDFLDIACYSIIDYLNANSSKYGVEVVASMHNESGIRSDFEGGDFTYSDLIRVTPFRNTLIIMKVPESRYQSVVLGYRGHKETKNPKPVNGYYYVGTINYVSESFSSFESIDTKITIQEAMEFYLSKNNK